MDRRTKVNSTIARPAKAGRVWWDATIEGANYTGIGKARTNYHARA